MVKPPKDQLIPETKVTIQPEQTALRRKSSRERLALPGEETQVSRPLQEVKTHRRQVLGTRTRNPGGRRGSTSHFRDGGPRGSRRVARSLAGRRASPRPARRSLPSPAPPSPPGARSPTSGVRGGDNGSGAGGAGRQLTGVWGSASWPLSRAACAV